MGCKGSKHALHGGGGGGGALEPRKCASGLVARHSVALRSSTLGTLSLDRATAAAAVSFAGGEGAGTAARSGKEGAAGRCRSFAGWFPASPKVEPGQPVKRQRLAPPRTPTKTPARAPEEINVWELMDGLDDDDADEEEYGDCLDGQVPSACGSPEFDPDVLSAFREALAELSPPPTDADVVSDGGAVVKEEIEVFADVASDGGAVVNKEEIQVFTDVASDGGTVVNKEEIQVDGGAVVKKEEIQVFADDASDGGAIVKKEEIQVFAGVVRARLDVLQGRIDSRSQKNPPPPPESARRVVVYLTSLRGIRQTYEDCWAASTILSSYGVHVDERDLSMHAGYKEELRDALGAGALAGVLPQVFVDGWHLGGAEEVRRMHESGELAEALEACEAAPGAAAGGKEGPGGFAAEPCGGCGGARFVPCDVCSGSCKVFVEDEDGPGAFRRCPDCNENGLLRCPIC
uniref:Glutaredoxin domain-containing protein n=1 Tax=Aegilops tauschii subsp. strangulata TaxID=200361 RepID=A0A453R671_AEGTS